MKGVQCYELFGGIALKNHAFSFSFSMPIFHGLGKLINELPDINVEPTTRLKAQMLQVIGKFIGN